MYLRLDQTVVNDLDLHFFHRAVYQKKHGEKNGIEAFSVRLKTRKKF